MLLHTSKPTLTYPTVTGEVSETYNDTPNTQVKFYTQSLKSLRNLSSKGNNKIKRKSQNQSLLISLLLTCTHLQINDKSLLRG